MKTDAPSPPRSLWRWIFRCALALIALLLLATAGFAWWLWGWRLGSLSFHESWTPEQRAALQAMHENQVKGMVRNYLRFQDQWDEILSKLDSPNKEFSEKFIKQVFFPLYDLPLFIQYVKISAAFRPICVQMDDVLRHVAATGRADYYTAEDNLSAAYIAVRCGNLDMVKQLVLRGNDPNHPYLILPARNGDEDSARYETVFQAAIACAPYFMGEAPPLAQRLELLDWLLAHGANINVYARQGEENMPLLIAAIAGNHENDQLPPEQRGVLLEWLLDHGLQIDKIHSHFIIHTQLAACHMSVLRRIVDKGYLGSPTPEQKAHILRTFLGNRVQDKAAKVLWALDELGADPNLTLIKEKLDEDDPELQETPTMNLAVQPISYATEPLNEAELAEQLQVLDILLAHGGKIERPDSKAPKSPDLRARYMELISKYTPQDEK